LIEVEPLAELPLEAASELLVESPLPEPLPEELLLELPDELAPDPLSQATPSLSLSRLRL
jgi:hypothetical protein